MRKAACGIVGLETSFALGYTELVKRGILSLSELVAKMSTNPAKVLGIAKGTLKPGTAADVVVADIDTEYAIDSSKFLSKGTNTPFDGKLVYGKVLNTFVDGKLVYSEERNG